MSPVSDFRHEEILSVEPGSTIFSTVKKLERRIRKRDTGFTITSIFSPNHQLKGLVFVALSSPFNPNLNTVRIEHDDKLQANQIRVVYFDNSGFLTSNTVTGRAE
jgi:hypothetical protein